MSQIMQARWRNRPPTPLSNGLWASGITLFGPLFLVLISGDDLTRDLVISVTMTAVVIFVLVFGATRLNRRRRQY